MNPVLWATNRLRTLSGAVARRARGLGSGYVPAAPILSGTYITPQTALGLTAVYSAINTIARDVACLPLNVYRKIPGGGFRVDDGHPLHDMLHVAPNEENDAYRFRRDLMGHVLGWGNGYAEIVRDGDGRPVELHMLHPSKTVPRRTEGRDQLYYELDNKRRLAPEDTLHLAGLGFDGLVGYTPLTVARQSIGVGIAAEQFGASLFGNGAIPRGILKTPKKLGEAAVNNLRRSWNQVHQGSQSANQLAILEEGMDWVMTQITPEDAQFLQTRAFTVLEIARLYGIPPHKIGDYSHAHLANVEESNLDYLQTTLLGSIVMAEAQLNLKLLTARDRRKWVIRHDMSAFMRGNMTARAAFYQVLRNLGVMSANDIIEREGWNPIPAAEGGDLYLVQSQYTELKNAGKQQDPGYTPPTPDPVPLPPASGKKTSYES